MTTLAEDLRRELAELATDNDGLVADDQELLELFVPTFLATCVKHGIPLRRVFALLEAERDSVSRPILLLAGGRATR